MKAVKPTDLYFDVDKILSVLSPYIGDDVFDDRKKLRITVPEDNAELYYSEHSRFIKETSTYEKVQTRQTIAKEFAGTYLEEVINRVKEICDENDWVIERVRVLRIDPLHAYTYHRDEGEFRYHIPLKTNENSIFIVGGVVESMPEIGRLYRFDTNQLHTAMNADQNETRMHLLFDIEQKAKSLFA